MDFVHVAGMLLSAITVRKRWQKCLFFSILKATLLSKCKDWHGNACEHHQRIVKTQLVPVEIIK